MEVSRHIDNRAKVLGYLRDRRKVMRDRGRGLRRTGSERP
tara:strand:+ start:604 stop:723 length:120 start_codon:yes stop_codon:yes gene_type:complete